PGASLVIQDAGAAADPVLAGAGAPDRRQGDVVLRDALVGERAGPVQDRAFAADDVRLGCAHRPDPPEISVACLRQARERAALPVLEAAADAGEPHVVRLDAGDAEVARV